ncbi:MAG: LytTR family DNA-binding domain-containing protein [Acidobacteriota bacterium]
MRVLIADDEPIARQILREYVESIPGLEIAGEATTGTETLQRILDLDPDLVLLDQQMPELDGLNVVRNLRGRRMPLVIFVTAFEQHALDAFEVGAVDYLLKPVRRERLEKAIEKARRQWKPPEAVAGKSTIRKIAGKRGTDIYLLDPAEIIAFQAEGDIVHIVTATQKYFAESTLKELVKDPGLATFRRVHRATLINSDHIRKISPLSSRRWLLKMSNGFEAVVSKRLASSIREQARW